MTSDLRRFLLCASAISGQFRPGCSCGMVRMPASAAIRAGCGSAFALPAGAPSLWLRPPQPSAVAPDAPFPLFPARAQGGAGRGRDRLPQADAARRHDPAALGRHLQLAAAGLRRAAEGRADRPRGDERGRRHRDPDADDPAGRPVARERPLRGLWQGDAAHQGPARARHALRADQRGERHRHLPPARPELPPAAAQPLPHPVEVPRRGAAPLRRDARPRVPDEGRLQLRPRP